MGFFDRPEIRRTPEPEPAGYDLLRDMLMRRIFEMNANPYGLSENYRGPSPFNPQGRGAFNPYQGGYGGGGMPGSGGAPGGMPGGGGQRLPQMVGPRNTLGGMFPGGMGGGGKGAPGMEKPNTPGGRSMTPNESPRQSGGGEARRKPAPARGRGYDGEPEGDECGYGGKRGYGAVGVNGGAWITPEGGGDGSFMPWSAVPGGGPGFPGGMGGAQMGPELGPMGGGNEPFGRPAMPGGRMRPMRPRRPGYDAIGPTAVGVNGGAWSTPAGGGQGGFIPWNADMYRGGATPPDPNPNWAQGSPPGLNGPPNTLQDHQPRALEPRPEGTGGAQGTNWWDSFPQFRDNPPGGGTPPGAGNPNPQQPQQPAEPRGPNKPPGAYNGSPLSQRFADRAPGRGGGGEGRSDRFSQFMKLLDK